jgi:hypothetical protein
MPRGYLKVFQYGSNMNLERINCAKRLNGKAWFATVALLEKHGVRFDIYSTNSGCGATNIASAENEYVLGVVFDIPIRLVVAPRGKRSRMDRFEGARPDGTGNYKRVWLEVTVGDRSFSAVTYVGTDVGKRRFHERNPIEQQVSEEYFGHLRLGA